LTYQCPAAGRARRPEAFRPAA